MKIRYYGHVGHPSGYGRAASDNCMALLAAGVELEIVPIRAAGSEPKFSLHYMPLASCLRSDHEVDPKPDVVIVHTLPFDCMKVFVHVAGQSGGHQPKMIAYTTWETSSAPIELLSYLASFNQVWVPSKINALAFTTMSGPTIRVLPHAFDESTYEARRSVDTELSSTGRYTFYYVGAWTTRKNPMGVVRAFAHAFGGRQDVDLRIHCAGAQAAAINACAASTGLSAEALRGLRPSIGALPEDDILGLHQTADCFVTAARGEAWNLPAFDAMLAGRHVIAPRGLGSDEFLLDTSAELYDSRPTPVQVDVRLRDPADPSSLQVIGAQGLDASLVWGEPDLLELSDLMRDAVRYRTRTITTHYDPRARFGYAAIGKLALQYIKEIQ